MSYCFLQDIGVDVNSMERQAPIYQGAMELPKLNGAVRSQSTGSLAGANLTASLHRKPRRSLSRPASGTTKPASRRSSSGSPTMAVQAARTLPLELQLKGGTRDQTSSVADRFSRMAISAELNAPASLDGLPAVLFLDVDGVLHSVGITHQRQQFAPHCMKLLKEVVARCQATIVLSTAWREHPDGRRAVAEKLREWEIPAFVSRTPSIARFRRTREILAWVRKHKPATWVAVDDLPLLEEDPDSMTGHFVQTRQFYGLQPATADKIEELFRFQKQRQEASGSDETFLAARGVNEAN